MTRCRANSGGDILPPPALARATNDRTVRSTGLPSAKGLTMTDEKEPSAPYGVPDKDATHKPNPKTDEPSTPYGVEKGTETTEPARKEDPSRQPS